MNSDNDNPSINERPTLSQPKLPNMNEFSPGTLGSNNIKELLKAISPFSGDKDEIIKHLETIPNISRTPDAKQRKTRANNVLIGMSQCNLLEKNGRKITGEFTELAKTIISCKSNKDANDLFAIHLLQNCHGLELFDVVSVIRGRGESIVLQNIREELRTRGFKVTENEGNASKIRQWLESTGIVKGDEWNIDNNALHYLIGATFDTTNKWSSLSRSQRVFLEAVKNIQIANENSWLSVRHIKDLCELNYGRSIFPEGHLRRVIIEPLVANGWIQVQGTGMGRGGDSGSVKALPQLTDIKIPFPVDSVSSIPIDLKDKLSKPLEEIFLELGSTDIYIKGIALELLSLRIARDIGLFPVCFRERSNKTQGAEVDIIVNGVHLHYSRWLMQCKNTSKIHVSDIAKEVGMAVVLKAQVIAIITTGKIGSTVHKYADGLASSSSLQAILIDGEVLKKYRTNGADAIIEHLRNSAYRVLKQKESQVLECET